MKKSKLNWMLAALIVLLIAPTIVLTRTKSKPRVDPTMYYWYDATGSYLGYQNTIDLEIAATGWNESTSSPKTLRELGYAPANVTPTPFPPTPIGSPDKYLYSHP
jgi:hypothetical protein